MISRLTSYWDKLAGPSPLIPGVLQKFVSLGSELLSRDPNTFEETVHQLFEVALYMDQERAHSFLDKRVTRQTFSFQARFRELVEPSTANFTNHIALHINTASLLTSVPDRILIPPSIRNPDSDLDRDDPFNRKYVCFCADSIDSLSIFLVGHALLRSPGTPGSWRQPNGRMCPVNLAEAWALEPTGQCFGQEFMLAVLYDYTKAEVYENVHDIESPVRTDQGLIKLIGVSDPVQVELIQIPATVLLDSQKQVLEQEALAHKYEAIQAGLIDEDAFEFPSQYRVTRHAELAVKLVLLEMWEANFATTQTLNPDCWTES